MTQARDLGDAANKVNYLDNVTSDIQAQLGGTPAGIIQPFGGSTAPTGYLACDGSVVSRTTYADLFAAIGTLWNLSGELSTEFRLPDFRAAFLRGAGTSGARAMANGSYYTMGAVGTYVTDQMQGHWHNYAHWQYSTHENNHEAVAMRGTGTLTADTGNGGVRDAKTDGTNGTPRTGAETIPFNAGVLYIIKT